MSATKGKLTEHQRAVWRTASLRPDDDFSPDTKQCAARRAARRRCRGPCRSNVTVCVGNDITDVRRVSLALAAAVFCATAVLNSAEAFPNPNTAVNMSVWSGLDSPGQFRLPGQREGMRRRGEWFFSEWKFHSARWWVPRGQRCDRRCGQGPTAALCVAARFLGNLLN